MKRLSVLLVSLLAISGMTSRVDAQATEGAKISKKEAALRAQAKVSEATARATALASVPGSTVKEGELEKENGKLIWSYDLKVAGKKGVEEVQVDATTGKILSRAHESDAKEVKEARDEAQGKAKTKSLKPAVPKP